MSTSAKSPWSNSVWFDDYDYADPTYCDTRLKSQYAPVNSRYRHKVTEHVTWREILRVCGYMFAGRNFTSSAMVAGVRADSHLGEVFYVLCKYHSEKTASLCMIPRGFNCFGCGVQGDKVDFVAGVMHLRSAQSIKQFFTDHFEGMRNNPTPS